MEKTIKRWLIVATSINFAIVLVLSAMVFGFTVGNADKNDNFTRNTNTITLSVPSSVWNDDTAFILPARTLLVDNSEWNYSMLLNTTSIGTYGLKSRTSNYEDYVKEIDISEYATFEDVCVQLFLNLLREARIEQENSVHISMPLSWYSFYDGYDFSTVNTDRLRFKCELIAQKYGMTTYGNIELSDDYFSVNIYPIN